MNRINRELLRDVEYISGSFHVKQGGNGILYNPASHMYEFTDGSIDLGDVAERIREPATIEMPEYRKFRVEITEKCNGNCSYCLVYRNGVVTGEERNMPVETAERLVGRFNEEIGSSGSIMIMGGEPLMNWPATRVFLEKSKGHVNIYTNGTAMTGEMLDAIQRHDGRVFISFDGSDAGSNSMRVLRSGAPMFARAIENYGRIKSGGIKTAINLVATDKNVRDMRSHVRHFVDVMGCRTMGLAHPHYIEFGEAPLDIGMYVEEMRHIFGYAKENGVYIDQIAKRLLPILDGKYRMIGCKLAGEQRTFDVEGNEVLCTKMQANPLTAGVTLVNIADERLPVNSDYCHDNCIGEGSCGGGCYFDAYIHSTDAPADERECRINIGLVSHILVDMLHEHVSNGASSREDFRRIYEGMLSAFK